MRHRLLILPLAAAIIAALSAYKLTRTYDAPAPDTESVHKRPAPRFALFDHHKPPQPVRLEAYVGRHEILLVFFDGPAGFDRDPLLMRLLSQRAELESSGLIVFGISTALPQENRRAIEELIEGRVLTRDDTLPFRLLSDVDYRVHKQWNRWDHQAERTRPAAFLIDRAGNIAWTNGAPQPITAIEEFLDERLSAT